MKHKRKWKIIILSNCYTIITKNILQDFKTKRSHARSRFVSVRSEESVAEGESKCSNGIRPYQQTEHSLSPSPTDGFFKNILKVKIIFSKFYT